MNFTQLWTDVLFTSISIVYRFDVLHGIDCECAYRKLHRQYRRHQNMTNLQNYNFSNCISFTFLIGCVKAFNMRQKTWNLIGTLGNLNTMYSYSSQYLQPYFHCPVTHLYRITVTISFDNPLKRLTLYCLMISPNQITVTICDAVFTYKTFPMHKYVLLIQ